jgi:hypothetical protein
VGGETRGFFVPVARMRTWYYPVVGAELFRDCSVRYSIAGLRSAASKLDRAASRPPPMLTLKIHNLGLEAPPGFEPGMEVLQTVQGCVS